MQLEPMSCSFPPIASSLWSYSRTPGRVDGTLHSAWIAHTCKHRIQALAAFPRTETSSNGSGARVASLARSPLPPSSRSQIDNFLPRLSFTRAQRVDLQCVSGVRNLLFGRGMGMDLLAIDCARLADQGVPFHSQMREILGMAPLSSIEAVSSDATTRTRLREAFGTQIQGIDLLTGGLAEDHVAGASMGATFQRLWWINMEQARTSDRFWVERVGSLSADTGRCCDQTDGAQHESRGYSRATLGHRSAMLCIDELCSSSA